MPGFVAFSSCLLDSEGHGEIGVGVTYVCIKEKHESTYSDLSIHGMHHQARFVC